MQGFDVAAAGARLRNAGGGYEMVHESPGLELGVYVLVAPEPDGQTPHAHGEVRHLAQGDAVFVAARAEHRFSGYDVVSLLVIFNGPHSASKRDGQTS